MHHLIEVRKATPAFGGNRTEVLNLGNDHVFAYARTSDNGQRVLVLANFAEGTQAIAANELRLYGLNYHFSDLSSGRELTLGEEPLVLEPYQVLWLKAG